MLLYLINYVKSMYMYIVLLLVRTSGRPSTFRPTGRTGRPDTTRFIHVRIGFGHVPRHVGQHDLARSINGS
jgi:hypothetical protein